MSATHMSDHAFHDQRTLFERLYGSSKGAWAAAGIALLYLIYNSFLYFGLFPLLLPLSELFWNVLVFAIPARLAIALDKWKSPTIYESTQPNPQSRSEMHATKSAALRRVFGLEGGPVKIISGARSVRKGSWLGGMTSTQSNAPPGLGNWDNSCYQNSVLQGLAALRSLTAYLEDSDAIKQQDSSTTAGSLRETISKLNDAENNGRRLWTPAKLKSMSSWQQQDAQEYFSKIMDDMEKETAKVLAARVPSEGLKEVKNWEVADAAVTETAKTAAVPPQPSQFPPKTPLDGYLAQRVACLRCGFSEGLSMIPFNCLTVPLGNNFSYDLSQCLDSYTSLEEISGVECAKCTLLQQKTKLETLTKSKEDDAAGAADGELPDMHASAASLPSELREMMLARLQAVQQALDDSDFSDATLSKKCQIPKKARVNSTKTKQMVVGRAPTGLVVHVNRSMFDENTGDLRKNLAHVNYPKVLDLGPWCLGIESPEDAKKEEWRMDPAKSMISGSQRNISSQSTQYVLRAAVCHYGRHENGHYICYREHPESEDCEDEGAVKMRWWRLSDDDVSPVTEDQVLRQGGVFMLFYEKIEMPEEPKRTLMEEKIDEKVAALMEVGESKPDTLKQDDVEELDQSAVEAGKSADASHATADEPVAAVATQPSVGPQPEPLLPAQEPTPTPPPTDSHMPQRGVDGTAQQAMSDIWNKTPPPTMRTARRGSKMSKGGFESVFRPVAAI